MPKCEHEGCDCEATQARFCSDSCREAQARGQAGDCGCGHPDCEG